VFPERRDELSHQLFEQPSHAIRIANHANFGFEAISDLRPFAEKLLSEAVSFGHSHGQLLFQARVAPDCSKRCEHSAHRRGRKRFDGPFYLSLGGDLFRPYSVHVDQNSKQIL